MTMCYLDGLVCFDQVVGFLLILMGVISTVLLFDAFVKVKAGWERIIRELEQLDEEDD